MRRAKAVALLALSVLVASGICAIFFTVEHADLRRPGSRDGQGADTAQLSATSADAKVDMEQHTEGATTVTTYTITGRY